MLTPDNTPAQGNEPAGSQPGSAPEGGADEGGTPAAAPPAPAPAPAPAAAPAPKPPAPPASAAARPAGKKRREVINIPKNEFLARIRREAAKMTAAQVQEALGVPIDEAREIIANAKSGQAQPGAAAAPVTDRRTINENARLKAENNKLRSERDRFEVRLRKQKSKSRDKIVEERLRSSAALAGVKDVDYAVELYSRAVRTAAAASKDIPEPTEFWGGLRTSHPVLFGDAAPAAPPATTAPPESPQPGGERPQPAPPGASTGKPETVDDMPPGEFADRTHRLYGIRPGM